MCLQYRCRGCRNIKTIYCSSADWDKVNPDCHEPTIDPQPHIKHKKCYACHTVEGTIRKLQIMVFQKPWLETEGLAGEESRPDWELQGFSTDEDSDEDWVQEHNNQLVARLEAMGLGELEGREELNDGHGIANASNSNDTNPTGAVHDSGSNRLVPVWGSDQETWNSEAREAQESEGKIENDSEWTFVESGLE